METPCKAAKELDEKMEKEDARGEIRSWISEKTFGFVRKKALARRFNQREEAATCCKELKKSLGEDQKPRHEEMARELESLLAKDDIKGALGKAQKWCRKRGQAAPKPAHQDKKPTTTCHTNPEGNQKRKK